MTVVTTSTWASASFVFLLAVLLRAIRLYISLGDLRPSFRTTCFAHVSGVVLGYLTFALSYECLVAFSCTAGSRRNFLPICYSLMILRSFDAVAMLIFAFAAMPLQDMRFLILFLVLIILVIWIIIYGFDPIATRLERKILTHPKPFAGDRLLLQKLHLFRNSLAKLPWERRGTLPLIIALSIGSWFLEWLAMYLYFSAAFPAALVIVDRVAGSLGFVREMDMSAYSALMPIVYLATTLLAGLYLWGRFGIKREHHG